MQQTQHGFDLMERKILAELVKDCRASDNAIAKSTGIPVNTVNRKRKSLEARGLITYCLNIEHGPFPAGSGAFGARQLYIITLRHGISRGSLSDYIRKTNKMHFIAKHCQQIFLGEQNGRLTIMMLIESRIEADIVEIFNVELLPWLEAGFGAGAVSAVQEITLTMPVQLLHNYFPGINIKHGKIREDWPSGHIFVG